MSDNETVPTQLILQNKLQGRSFDNWSPTDVVVAVISALVAIFTAAAANAWVGSTGALLIFLFVVLSLVPLLIRSKKSYGRGYRMLGLIFSSMNRRLSKRGLWWKGQDTEYPAKRRSRVGRVAKRRPPVIPVRTEIVDTTDMEGEGVRFALTHHLDQPLDHLYIKCTGGDFANLDAAAQNACVQELANIVNRTLSMSELKAGVAYLRVTAPTNDYDHVKYLTANGNPVVFKPELFKLDPDTQAVSKWLSEYSNQLMPVAREFGGADEWNLIVITIKRHSEWRGVSKGKSNEQLYNLPVLRLGRTLVRDLQKSSLLNFGDVHILKPEELFLLNRVSWDAFNLEDFYAKYSSIITRNQHDERAMYAALEAELSCWPEKSIVSPEDDCIRMDDSWISVIRVTGLPGQIRADQYLSLRSMAPVSKDVWIRAYSGGEAISGTRETFQLMAEQAVMSNMHDVFFRNSVVRHPGVRRRQQQLERQSEVVHAASIAQFSNEYYTIVASSRPALVDAREGLIADLHSRGFEAETINLLALQLDAFLTGALGASRL